MKNNIECHIEGKATVMSLSDVTDSFAKAMVMHFLNQQGINCNYCDIKMPVNSDRSWFGIGREIVTIIYT